MWPGIERGEDYMFNWKFRIGAKMAATAGIGVVLMLGMLGNQVHVTRLSRELSHRAGDADELVKAVLRAELELRRAIINDRNVRNALSTEEVDKALPRLKEISDNGNKALDDATSKAMAPDIRTQLTQVRDLQNTFMAASNQIALLQKQYIDLRNLQAKLGLDWPKKLNPLLKSPAVAGNAEMVRTLEHADSEFKQARLLFWAYLVRSDSDIPGRLQNSIKASLKLLEQARGMTSDQTVLASIDDLMKDVPQYSEVVAKTFAKINQQNGIMKDRADPARLQAGDLTEQLKTDVNRRSDEVRAQFEAETTRAEWINLTTGVFVLLVLVGSAVFSMFNIAKPIRRIGEVLLALAQGDKGVEIPYAGRGDEVGDAARAARTFKDNLLR
ncbi:MAG TPA: HAMP domain-containing protein, partial [Xanthobacteraceae bacterium]|nr:HAMP domain-containing protein [Xanthobacteraceae bacterium]